MVLGLLVLGCAGGPAPASPAAAPAVSAPVEAAPSIGSAKMLADGTLVLQLRAEGANGELGDARFSYPPTHKRYAEIKAHLAPIEPGEEKAVPPFPE